jgi:nucleotide-binding universal stress UspA family protein
MPGPILVGYDGTEGAKAALAEALRLAGALGVEIVVAFAYWAGALGGEGADLVDTLRDRGQAVTAEALETARAAGVEGRAELVNDRPAEALAQAAEEFGAQMIAVGSYGERPLRALIVGSTAPRLMHITAVPVLVVREVPPPAP